MTKRIATRRALPSRNRRRLTSDEDLEMAKQGMISDLFYTFMSEFPMTGEEYEIKRYARSAFQAAEVVANVVPEIWRRSHP